MIRHGWIPKNEIYATFSVTDREYLVYCEEHKDVDKHKKIELRELDRSRCVVCTKRL